MKIVIDWDAMWAEFDKWHDKEQKKMKGKRHGLWERNRSRAYN